jgi:peptide/nickel transport system substrate-binding protein
MVDCSGPAASFGWPDSPEVQAALGDWFDAASPEAEREAGVRANRAAMDYVPFIPTGFFLGYTAWRRGVEGIVQSPFPAFWDVRKS